MSPFKKWIKLVLVATVGALAVRAFVVEDFRVTSNSMVPTLWPGDLVLANKLATWKSPGRGDVVIFSLPNEPYQNYVKRVVGLQGDTVVFREGKLTVNGAAARYEIDPRFRGFPGLGDVFLETLPGTSPYPVYHIKNLPDAGPFVVPAGHCFVLGDNRGDSVDGRHYGPIPLQGIRARFAWTLFSVDMYGSFRKARSVMGYPLPFRTR